MYTYIKSDNTTFEGEIFPGVDELKKNNVCAYEYKAESPDDKKDRTAYYVRLYENRLYNPHDSLHNRSKGRQVKFRLVRKMTFDAYILFLKENRKALFTQAERSL